LPAIIPENPPSTDFLDSFVHKLNDANAAINRLFGLDEGFGRLTTNADKQLNDQLIAIGEFGQKAQEILGQSLSLREQNKGGDGAINELKQLDAMLAQIEQRKVNVDPANEDAIAQIRQEEEALLKRRADAQKEVQATQSAINNALTQARQELQNLDPAQMGQEGYDRAKEQIETQITLLEREKTELDKVANAATQTAQVTADAFSKSNHEIEAGYQQRQAAIAEALASGELTKSNRENDRYRLSKNTYSKSWN
jgi:DNA repair exonuclease SbcCD ATPase subunit